MWVDIINKAYPCGAAFVVGTEAETEEEAEEAAKIAFRMYFGYPSLGDQAGVSGGSPGG